MTDPRIVPAGDAAWLVEFPPRIAPEINARILSLAGSIRRRCATALRDVVIGYCTLTVFFDPLAVDAAWLEGELREAASELRDGPDLESPIIDVPVCYGGDLGPDLEDVAAFGRCSADEVIALHAATLYRVYMVGFVPGFPYMAEVESRIAAPRRPSPRVAVPAGSVAVAGPQTGIYPAVTPGGWNIIGRTPVKPYDASRAVPFLFQPGDRVRFHPVDRTQFDRCS